MCAVFVPAVISEFALIGEKLPSWQEVMQERVAPLIGSLKTRFPQAYNLLQQHLAAWAQENLPTVAERAVRWVGKATVSVLGLVSALFNLVLVPVIAAYLTVDFRRFLDGLRKLVPRPVLTRRGVPLRVVDIATNPALFERFGERVPILEVDREIVAEGGGSNDAAQAALIGALEART